jgi:hypothetical protein
MPPPYAAATDRVGRQFAREAPDQVPDQLWVTDITEHPTREGKVYCAVVRDAYSRRVVGWSIDAAPTAALVTNALGKCPGHGHRRTAAGQLDGDSQRPGDAIRLVGVPAPGSGCGAASRDGGGGELLR